MEFQAWLKKSVSFISTDYILPAEICAMVNVALDAKNQALKLCAVEGVDIVSQIPTPNHHHLSLQP